MRILLVFARFRQPKHKNPGTKFKMPSLILSKSLWFAVQCVLTFLSYRRVKMKNESKDVTHVEVPQDDHEFYIGGAVLTAIGTAIAFVFI
jgi:hypothetical protein